MKTETGFSLIETIIAIVIISIAVTGVMIVFVQNIQEGARPFLDTKSIQIGQSMMDEILLKRFDEDTPLGGGRINTALSNIGTEGGESGRTDFDDLDDYNGYSDGVPGEPLQNELGNDISSGFQGFSRSVVVEFYKPADAPAGIPTNDYKRVRVQITGPTGDTIELRGIKTNH